eukprot:scaffold324_cov326-Pavlova_lutheri.AAC.43
MNRSYLVCGVAGPPGEAYVATTPMFRGVVAPFASRTSSVTSLAHELLVLNWFVNLGFPWEEGGGWGSFPFRKGDPCPSLPFNPPSFPQGRGTKGPRGLGHPTTTTWRPGDRGYMVRKLGPGVEVGKLQRKHGGRGEEGTGQVGHQAWEGWRERWRKETHSKRWRCKCWRGTSNTSKGSKACPKKSCWSSSNGPSSLENSTKTCSRPSSRVDTKACEKSYEAWRYDRCRRKYPSPATHGWEKDPNIETRKRDENQRTASHRHRHFGSENKTGSSTHQNRAA